MVAAMPASPLAATVPATAPAHGLRFRAMTGADLDAVMAIEVEAYPFPWTRGNFLDSLACGYRLWVAETGTDSAPSLVGYGVVTVHLDEAELMNITVTVASQGQGWGRALLDQLMADARERHVRRMFLEVRPSNLPARALYQRAGFIEIGRRKGYYPAAVGREDALVLARDL